MTNYREILRLENLGLNNTQIAESVKCSRTTVINVLRLAKEKGLKYPLPELMSDKDVYETLFSVASGKAKYKMPDYEHVYKELQRDGVTLDLLWREYVDECRQSGELPYQSTQFNKYYNDFCTKKNATMHLNHKPGEIMQVDWAGDTTGIIDTDTGELIKVYVFVATLPFSGYSYVEGFFSMNQECWTTAHVNAYKYFGGVTKMIQCDNLKTGVLKHGKDEVELNRSYRELTEHYNTAVVPARVRSPKDKAFVEGTVGVISTFILAALRNRQFLSLPELNEAIWDKLYEFNHKPFQKKDGSRASMFEEEKPFLMQLPAEPFELSQWKVATVGPNYHIAVEKMNYSVPYEYIKQKVDVRLTRNMVEVFFSGNRICSHIRLYGRANQYSTNEEHMPPDHKKYVAWNGDRFIAWASKIGPNTEIVIKAILSSYKVEQQGYKSCLALLKLADKYSVQRLEKACTKALTYTPQPSFKHVKTILASGQDTLTPAAEPTFSDATSQYGFTRGADYYGRAK
ncbi:MAG: IS21 family transposase [Oscillospiraceae bacterium]|nr:IS21 family transposase [Oscillospiraceae bacterium]